METMCLNREEKRLFCRVEGEGTPLLLIHGSIVDGDFFEGVSEILRDSFRVITYDRRGYSRSERCAQYGLQAQAEDAACILRQLGMGKKAVVVGCSLGAIVALRLAADWPELVRCVIVHEPPLLCFPDITDPEETSLLAAVKREAEAGKYKSALFEFLTLSSRYPYERAKPYPPEKMDQQLKNGIVFAQHEYLSQFFEDRSACGLDRLAGMDVFCLAGDSSGPTFTVKAAQRLAQELDRPFMYVPGAHNAAHDLPMEFAAMLVGLLALKDDTDRRSNAE